MELTLSAAIGEYIAKRGIDKLEDKAKAKIKDLAAARTGPEKAKVEATFFKAEAVLKAQYKPETWLTDAASRANQISLATHSVKFTHSDARASSVLESAYEGDQARYVVTASLKNKTIDAVGNAAAHDVATLLKITVDGDSLVEQLQSGHVNALGTFTSDEAVLNSWRDGFRRALFDEQIASHRLTKQLYFPVGRDGGDSSYHLLLPLFPSSLAHSLHRQVWDTRSSKSKEVRDARKAQQYHKGLDERFPNTAIQNFGGSKPQNISQLNSERGGRGFLLSCEPPSYKTQSGPPKSKSLFDNEFGNQNYQLIVEFRAFLAGLTGEDHNFRTRYRRDHDYVQPILDQLLARAEITQNLKSHAGWSSKPGCQLKRAHALWLDTHNPNNKFQIERASGDWLEIIATDFSNWLLRKLENKRQYMLGDVEQRYFKKLCLTKLTAFERHTPKYGEG